MMGKTKLRIFIVALVAVLLTFIGQPSLAYYAIVGTATNVVTSGDIKLVIHETTDQGTPFPEEGVYIIPGDIVSKVVTVENDCDHPFYLRLKVVYGTDAAELSPEECFDLNINTEQWHYKDGWFYYAGIVEPHTFTPRFFSEVEIVGSKIDTSHIGSKLSLTVVAQAVQSENNPVENGDASLAFGWPAEE